MKHRSVDEVRVVPYPPELAAILHAHLTEHGTTPDGRLFRGARGGPLSESHYGWIWTAAQSAALSADEIASPLARRPYDLRHAAVSTWLSGGVPAPQVAAWAGHSFNVLLRVNLRNSAATSPISTSSISNAMSDWTPWPLARHGARVTGLDFSAPAINAATRISAEAGLAERSHFVAADALDATRVLGANCFDVVYTGNGAVTWLPDLNRWTDTVGSLLRPQVRLYLAEFHPLTDILDDDRGATAARDYFARGRSGCRLGAK